MFQLGIRPILIGKHAYRKGNIKHVRSWLKAISAVFYHRNWQRPQRISVPTDRQTLSMHQYLQSQGFCCSVGTPLDYLSVLSNCNVPCRYFCNYHVDFRIGKCGLSNLRKGPCHVTNVFSHVDKLHVACQF